MASASASLKTETHLMPNIRAVRMTRHAISPRLAMRILSITLAVTLNAEIESVMIEERSDYNSGREVESTNKLQVKWQRKRTVIEQANGITASTRPNKVSNMAMRT
jgi:hypothetical protein